MKNKVKKIFSKNWFERAWKTFVQASAGAMAILVPSQDWTMVKTALISVGIGMLSSGGCAVWHLLMDSLGIKEAP